MNYNREKFQTIESFENEFDIHFTMKHNAKMSGMVSLSTSPMMNTFCQNRSKCEGTICKKCYAMRMSKMYSKLESIIGNNYVPIIALPYGSPYKVSHSNYSYILNATKELFVPLKYIIESRRLVKDRYVPWDKVSFPSIISERMSKRLRLAPLSWHRACLSSESDCEYHSNRGGTAD